MRILYITQMYPSEKLPQYCPFLHMQVKALIANGVEVQVVIPSVVEETHACVFDDVPVLYLQYRDFSRSCLYGFVTAKLIKELKKHLKASNYDVIYAIHAPANILEFSRVVAKRNNKPLFVHYRGYNIFKEYEEEKKALFSNPERVKEKVVKQSDLSIGVSKKTVDIIKQRFQNAPTEVIYNGVDLEVFATVNEDAPDEVIKLLCVANLIPIKGHKLLLDAYSRICDKYPQLKLQLDIVGRGFLEEELKQYVVENNIKNVCFSGYVAHKDVAEYMKRTTIFVLPSVYESFGNVCLEAMACGKPVVIFEGQGIDEIIEDGYTGMIAKKGNAEDLELKIEKLLLDNDLRAFIAKNAREIAQQYTWDRSAKCIIESINKVKK